MTQKEHFKMILEKLNIKEYFDNGYKGQNVKIASVESLKSEHGRKVYLTLKTYAPLCDVYSFNDEFGISATGDQGTPETINFPKFVDWCIEKGIHIVTSSLNWDADEEVEQEAIKKLYEHGIIFFNATPNKDITVTIGKSDRACCMDKEVVGVSGLAINIKGKLTWCGFAKGNAIDTVSISQNLPIFYDADKLMSWSGNSAGTPLIVSMFADLLSSGFYADSKNTMEIIEKYSSDFVYENMTYNHFILPKLDEMKQEEKEEENMSVQTCKHGIQLTKHFNTSEFACPCCDVIKLDTSLVSISEKVFTHMNAYKIIITSGYRCNDYEMSLKGGVKNGYHTKGMAVDINVWKNKTERYTSKEICLALEDLGWNGGIGIISDTAVHIDTRTNKYWFDERKGNVSIGNSFYTYFGVKNNRQKVKEKFTLAEESMKYLDKYKYANELYIKLLK